MMPQIDITSQVVSIDEYRQVCQERDEWKQKATHYLEKWKAETARANGLHARIRFDEAIDAAPAPAPKENKGGLKASEKQFLKALGRVTAIKGEQARIYREDIVRHSGMSVQTVSDVAAKARDMGVIDYDYDPQRYNTPDGVKVDKVLHMRLKPEFKAAALSGDLSGYQFPEIARGLNRGQHFACKSCRSLNTKVVRQGLYEVACRACGEVHFYDPTNLKDKALILDDEAAQTWEAKYQEPAKAAHDAARQRVNARIEQIELARAPEPKPASPPCQIDIPQRNTICCNVPFQMGSNGSECSNPDCSEKKKRRVAS